MRGGSGLLIIVIGLVVIYLGITGRYKCFANFVACVSGDDAKSSAENSASNIIKPLEPLAPKIGFSVTPTFPQ